jgi:hypothetical protein
MGIHQQKKPTPAIAINLAFFCHESSVRKDSDAS